MAISSSTPGYYNPKDVVLIAGGLQFTDFMEGDNDLHHKR